jgi:NAD(P)H dehydrogenase (quinone)
MYGHIERMTKEVAAGVESSGCEVRIFQVAETLPAEVLAKMHAKEKDHQVPVIKVEQLPEADGILFGMPTRFGSAPTQMRALFDQCGGLWMSNALFGKPVSFLFHSLSFISILQCYPIPSQ